jgi:hypothetical protein
MAVFHSMQIHDISNDEFLRRFGFARCQPHTIARWMQSDSEQQWHVNQANRKIREKLKSCGWTDDNVQYRYNNYGFRSDDDFHPFNPKPGCMFLGCSLTEGIGLNIEQTWAHRLWRNELGGVFYNLGQGGTGIETQYRLMRAWAPYIKPIAIYTLGAIVPRREILNDYGIPYHIVGPWSDYAEGSSAERLLGQAETDISTQRTFDSMRYVATNLGIPLYTVSLEARYRAIHRHETEGLLARDAIHYTVPWHEELSRGLHDWERIA